MKIEKLPLINIADCYSKTDIVKKLNLPQNGTSMKKVSEYIEYHKLSTDHFDTKNRKYKIILKNCPVCNKEFQTQENHPKEKQTCSYSCSNTYFRSGENNPNYNHANTNYRYICFKHHKKECVVCKEQNIVAVHHYDKNHNNNEISNLVPLCPTHHLYVHSEYEHLVINQINDYVAKFKQAL